MTGRDVLKLAASIASETNYDQYIENELAILWLKTVVAENFNLANRRRAFDGLEQYRTVPDVTDIDEELPYDEVFVSMAFPYGLACKLFVDTMDFDTFQYADQKYERAKAECDRALCEVITEDTINW